MCIRDSLIAAPGKLAGINDGLGPKPFFNSAKYIFSLIDPINTKGLLSLINDLTSSLLVFFPEILATAKLQGNPKSFSKKLRIPREYVSFATIPKLAVAKKS